MGTEGKTMRLRRQLLLPIFLWASILWVPSTAMAARCPIETYSGSKDLKNRDFEVVVFENIKELHIFGSHMDPTRTAISPAPVLGVIRVRMRREVLGGTVDFECDAQASGPAITAEPPGPAQGSDKITEIWYWGRDVQDLVANKTGIPSRLSGCAGNDVLQGSMEGINWIYGGWGNDRLCGGDADDRLRGGPDNDEVTGRGGDDELFGGDGVDRLCGGEGMDKLRGEPEDDMLNGGNDGAVDLLAGDPEGNAWTDKFDNTDDNDVLEDYSPFVDAIGEVPCNISCDFDFD